MNQAPDRTSKPRGRHSHHWEPDRIALVCGACGRKLATLAGQGEDLVRVVPRKGAGGIMRTGAAPTPDELAAFGETTETHVPGVPFTPPRKSVRLIGRTLRFRLSCVACRASYDRTGGVLAARFTRASQAGRRVLELDVDV